MKSASLQMIFLMKPFLVKRIPTEAVSRDKAHHLGPLAGPLFSLAATRKQPGSDLAATSQRQPTNC